ncbi:MAG: M56 family metallopeptidase, partial [Planctomycetaceae bacterium]|nr:M56 family metallopeptidase [Planctomycetaceae bacterium]
MLTFLIKLLFGSTILLLAALILSVAFQRASATFRHRIWAGAFVGLLILPMLSPLLPSWAFRVRNAEFRMQLQAQSAERKEQSESIRLKPVLPEVVATPPHEFSEAHAPHIPQESPAMQVVPKPQLLSTSFLVPGIVIYSTVAAVLLLKLILAMRGVTRMLRRLEPVSDMYLTSMCRRLNIRRSVRLMKSERAAVPLTCGMIRPVIVLPETCGRWSDEQRRAVLAHELAHVARHDVFWQIFSQAMCALYWFHPLAWLAAHRIRVERELACDDAVLLGGEKASVYADVLLELASGLRDGRQRLFGCTVAMTRRHTIKSRIKTVLNPAICRKQPGRVATMLTLIVAVFAIAFAAVISPFPKAVRQAKAEPTPEGQIAIPADAPKLVTLKGQVLMPDGSPAAPSKVWFTAIGLRINSPDPNLAALGFESEPSYRTFSHGTISSTNPEGRFSIDVPPGGNAVIYADSPTMNPPLVSEPVTFLLQENPPDVTIQLREGIPLRGRVVYGDDTPVQKRTITARRQLPLLVGQEVLDMEAVKAEPVQEFLTRLEGIQKKFFQEFQAKTDENGEYGMTLVPGEYVVREFDTEDAQYSQTIIVTEESGELTVNLRLPAPIRGRITLPDGSVP